MALTFDEIKAALADEGIKTQVVNSVLTDAQKALENSGMVIRTKEQDEAYLNAKVEPLVEVKIKDQIKALHEKYDQDLFELTGDRKKPEEKTYDFLKRKVTEIKEAAKGGNPVDKDQLKQLQEMLENEKKSKQTELSQVHETYFRKEVALNLSAAVAGFTIAVPSQLTDEQKTDFANKQKEMIVQNFQSVYTAKKDNDGNVVFYKGEELQVSTKDGKPLSAADLIAENYTTYFAATGRKLSGAGTAGGNELSASSTKEDVIANLKAKGISETSKEFMDQYEEALKKYGIVK